MSAKVEQIAGKAEEALLRAIWREQALGQVDSSAPYRVPGFARAYAVNDAYLVRIEEAAEDVARLGNAKLALEALRGNGVPAPEVVGFESDSRIAGGAYLVTTLPRGRPLGELHAGFDRRTQREAVRQMGDMLSRIHDSCRFAGFGSMPEVVAASCRRWTDWLGRHARDRCIAAAAAGLIDRQDGAAVRAGFERAAPQFSTTIMGALLHGAYDFNAVLFLPDGRLTGVIGFEGAVSGDPVWDLRLDERLEAAAPGSPTALLEGYQQNHGLADTAWEKLRLYRVLFHLDSALAAAGRKDASGAETERALFREALGQL
jgi:aminoglycoside phosphotransferase (APT) family kinase protein